MEYIADMDCEDNTTHCSGCVSGKNLWSDVNYKFGDLDVSAIHLVTSVMHTVVVWLDCLCLTGVRVKNIRVNA